MRNKEFEDLMDEIAAEQADKEEVKKEARAKHLLEIQEAERAEEEAIQAHALHLRNVAERK